MEKVDLIDAIPELYMLGAECLELIDELAVAQEKATMCRLKGWHLFAAHLNTEAAMLAAELETIGKRQAALISQLEAAEEVIYV